MDEMKILDKFEHIGVYVVDRKSLVVYYENAIAEQYTGRCRIGEPCYKVHGNDAMCSICPIREKDHITLVNRSDYNMVFAVRCEEIMWNGAEAYFITVVKQADSSRLTEDEKSMSRMSRALEKSVNVYTEINMETMRYRQINLRNAEGFNVDAEGEYALAYEFMCTEEIHPDDVAEVRRTMAPEVLRRISYESEGVSEVVARYRLKNVVPERIMESRAIFMRDEVPHYVVSIAKDVTEEYNLRKQADTLESILSNVSCGVAIYHVDENGAITVEYTNEGLARLAECSKETLTEEAAKDAMYTINAEYRDAFQAAFQRIIDGEKSADITLYATTCKDNHKWVNVNLSASQQEKGILQIYGSFFDVTADIKMQREFQEKYEVEKRRSQDDTTVLAYGVFDLLNGTTIEMERRSPFHAMEKQLSLDAFCKDICGSIVSKERQAAFVEMFNTKNLLLRHENGTDEQSVEYQRRLPDGKVIWVKSTFHVISDVSKNTVLLFYYCNDININKSLELMTSYMVDEDYDMLGCINMVDDSAIMLYGKNSSRRMNGDEGIHREERYSESLEWFVEHAVVPEERQFYPTKTFMAQIRKNLSERGVYEFHLHVQDENKNIRTKKIRYAQDALDADICFFSQTDITDTLAEEEEKQRQLQAALKGAEQANEAKTAFLSRMSHDMRTPMNGVLGLAALMRDETSLEEIAKDIDQLEMSGRYLLQLINDTLDVSKIESGKMELRLKPINSEMVFGNILANTNMLAKEKGIALVLDKLEIKHGEWVPVMADASRLEQVIMNVASNAIKFTPAGGTVTITMETVSITEQEVVDRYIIKDTGIGMSPEFLEHIYEPFAQEGRLNTDRENGTGLGMSIVKQLVALMNGIISVKSEVGAGTEVTLTMRYPVCEKTPEDRQKEQTNLSILENKRILLCEDHPLNAQIAERLLSKKGLLVVHAENGKIGVRQFADSAQGYFDAILMDIRMPEMNGLEVAKAIRALERPDAKTIPVIAMTANAFEDDVQDCIAAGMNAHIAKPIEPAVLYETIAKYIHKML